MSNNDLHSIDGISDANKKATETNTQDNKNVSIAIKLAVCYALMFGFGEKSFALFAHHLNAPLSFFAALIYIPSSLGPFIQIIAANVLDRYHFRIKLVYFSVLIQACCFIPLILIAFYGESFSISQSDKSMTLALYIFLITFIIYHISGNFYTPIWQSFIGDLVSQNNRGSFLARMTKYNFIFMFISQSIVGYALYYVVRNYTNTKSALFLAFTGCFFIAFLARFTSTTLLKKLQDIPYQTSENASFSLWQFLKRAPESNFVKFVFFVAVFQGGSAIASPYFVPYWLDTLKHTSSDWTILSSGSLISSIVALLIWGRFSDMFGNKKAITYCAIAVSIMPFFWLVSDNFYYLVSLEMFSEMFWTGFNLCTLNYIFEAASPPKRARCFAYYNLLLGIGIFIGSQIGLWGIGYFKKDLFDIHFNSSFCWILIASGTVRLLACLVFITSFKELREVKPFQLNSFWVDVLQLKTIFGFALIKNKEVDKKND